MKPENDNLEPNISRLLKLTGEQDRPSRAFTDSLIQDAMQELNASGADQVREGGHKIMRRKRVRFLSCAAAVLIGCALLGGIMLPSLNRVREAGRVAPLSTTLPEPWYDTGVAYDVGPEGTYAYSPESMVAYSETRMTYSPGWQNVAIPGQTPAHGGTVPPNGEDVDAMFFENYGVNPFVDTEDDHLSTFAADVDTASYAVVRAYLQDGHAVPKDSVRVEEFVNTFDYGYAAPQEDAFAVYMEAAPWSFGQGRKHSYLLRIGLKAREVSAEERKPAILTFVIDVSGSMDREDRLGLVKQSLRLLVHQLKPNDQIGIAVYGSRGMKVLDHIGLDQKGDILAVIDALQTEGSTNAEEGIRIGYDMAHKAFKQGCINRVILCSDGVANVGNTGTEDILDVIKDKAEKGITLSTLGFGMGNYNDVLMEKLGDKGDGYYAYIDTITQAKRLFGENLVGSLQVVAREVKIQVDFNPAVVRSYRLIGYENRAVPDERFRDDSYDGGELGAGHSATALYEVKLWADKQGTLATTHIRYKDADTQEVSEFKRPLSMDELKAEFAETSQPFRLAATVAEFAEILRQSYWAQGADLGTVLTQAQSLSREYGSDTNVIELVDLIAKAGSLKPEE
jgi:Ca-activated chloride channel family protein